MLKKYTTAFLFLFVLISTLTAQPRQNTATQKPKLVVGIVIDQMRWDYLYRFEKLYGPDGFKRILSQGYSFENTLIPYTPTYTAAGHTCVYTGSVPSIHGIVGNDWFEKSIDKGMYCAGDSTVNTVGSSSSAGKMSPRNMWTTTVTDELRLSNNFKSKVIGISLKDRGAILPAGHSANAAYWYDDKAGKFISSSFYFNDLPKWVKDFNDKDLVSKYMAIDWDLMKDKSNYTQAANDENLYETPISGEKTVSFPHKLSALTTTKLGALRYTPHGTTYSFDFAKAAVENEQLGRGIYTDFLALSISSTDYIGHNFGPNSLEIEDTYARLDKDLGDFLKWLDMRLGKGNYLFFLTADHAAAHVPAFLKEHNLPGGLFDDRTMMNEINPKLDSIYGIKGVIKRSYNYQFYLNHALIEQSGKDLEAIKATIVKMLKAYPFVVYAFDLEELSETTMNETQKRMMSNGYNPQRSGDIQFTVKPNYFDHGPRGTTHGAWNPYDAHIPLLWFGWNIKPGETNREVYMTDIAPTISAMLNIQMPSGNVGKPLLELVK
ncbi:MAG: alkaline phosphatase family protein [Sphingobacteriales bacterium]|nr:MAG: alkaline phosphatase family protein [Sphingobacteriales bacterium]